MTLQLLFAGLALLLASAAALLFVLVAFRRERQLQNLALAVLLMALAFGVWWTAVRQPFAVP
ncbi:MAG: hypothetical protein FJ028_04020 [Chloroflexi bacterium]|nr:hypothetical protein [Chloroflexota bacterium]